MHGWSVKCEDCCGSVFVNGHTYRKLNLDPC